MSETTVVNEQTQQCPECGEQLIYEIGGKPYSHLVGIYDTGKDRTVAWMCPGCEKRWER